jgi:hypothetical protein
MEAWKEGRRSPDSPGWTTLGKIRAKYLSIAHVDPQAKKRDIIAFHAKHDRWPSPTAPGQSEQRLGQALRNYNNRASTSYDPVFMAQLAARGRKNMDLSSIQEGVSRNKKALVAFFAKHRRIPSAATSASPEERRLGKLHYAYLTPKHHGYVSALHRLGWRRPPRPAPRRTAIRRQDRSSEIGRSARRASRAS